MFCTSWWFTWYARFISSTFLSSAVPLLGVRMQGQIILERTCRGTNKSHRLFEAQTLGLQEDNEDQGTRHCHVLHKEGGALKALFLVQLAERNDVH